MNGLKIFSGGKAHYSKTLAIKLIGLATHLQVEFCGFDCLNVKAVSELLKSTLQVSNIHETAVGLGQEWFSQKAKTGFPQL